MEGTWMGYLFSEKRHIKGWTLWQNFHVQYKSSREEWDVGHLRYLAFFKHYFGNFDFNVCNEAFINKLFLPWFLRMFQPSRPPSAYKTPYISDPLSHIGKLGATIIGFKLLTCSSRSVFFPHEARYRAAELPSTPAPTTQTSKRSPVIAILKQPWNGDSTNKRTGDFRESARYYPYLQVQIWF